MKHRNSHLLVGYWSRLRRGRAVPDQTDVDPRAIKRMLSYVFILDAADPGRPVYRLAGTSMCERFGTELKGTNFLTHWESQSRGALALLLKEALETYRPVCVSSVAATSECGMAELETVLAPVSFEHGAPARFLGMVQFLGDISQLLGRSIAFQRLTGSQFVREDEPVSDWRPPAPPMPPPPRPSLRSHPKAPHLRLIISRGQNAPLHHDMDCEMDRDMQRLIGALDVIGAMPLVRLR